MNIVDPGGWYREFTSSGELPERLRVKHARARKILSFLPAHAPVMAEIGVFAGELSEMLMLMRQDLHMVLVDSWGDYTERYEKSEFDVTLRDFQAAQAECHRRVSRFEGRGFMIKLPSDLAARNFRDGSFDMVYIDADHTYEGAKEDILAWFAKVKVGGYIGGHDYWGPAEFGVDRAVKEILGKWKIITDEPTCSWYVKRIT